MICRGRNRERRFGSEDPKPPDAGDYNLFRYCHNDPEDFTDPMGTETNMVGRLENPTAMFALWEMTKWFDRSNIIQGMFPGFAALSGQSDRDANGGLHIAQIEKGQKGSYGDMSPRQLGIQGVRWAEDDLKKTGDYYGYNFYHFNSELIWRRSEKGYWDGQRWVEAYPWPKGAIFVANGHLHPKPDREHPFAGTTWSSYDQRLSNGQTGGGRLGTGPVLKRSYERNGFYDEYNRGIRSLVRPDGSTEASY